MRLMLLALLSVFVGSVYAAPSFIVDTASGPRTDTLIFESVVYTGACPGSRLYPVRGYFFDPEVTTVPGRRVRIVNVTPGMSADPFPYTDREYKSGGRSEKIDFYPRSNHGQRYFSVLEGLNQFEVTYTDGGRIVKTDTFSFPVFVNTRYEARWPVCRVENDCHSTPQGGTVCVPRSVCNCIY